MFNLHMRTYLVNWHLDCVCGGGTEVRVRARGRGLVKMVRAR